MFLVTGFPKCGTQYVAVCLANSGYKVGHEIVVRGYDGVCSWTGIEKPDIFSPRVFIVRNPVDVINSALTINQNSMKRLGMRSISPQELIYAYTRWFKKCKKACKGPFKVEELPENSKEFFEALELKPQPWYEADANINTRKLRKNYGTHTLESLLPLKGMKELISLTGYHEGVQDNHKVPTGIGLSEGVF